MTIFVYLFSGLPERQGSKMSSTAGDGIRPREPLREAMADMSLNGAQKSEYDSNSQPMTAECAPSVRLMVTRPLEAVVNDSV
jgi:hypothetical protein